MKKRLFIHVENAKHFLAWELPFFEKEFELEPHPSSNTPLFAFGPDALISGANIPAPIRMALLFPGFGWNPFHDMQHRMVMKRIIRESYHLIFVNPGPIYEAFRDLPQIRICPFSINTKIIPRYRYRKHVTGILHASADFPQKDWTRSREIMKKTGLIWEVYPPRHPKPIKKITTAASKILARSPLAIHGYKKHDRLIKKYLQYDSFVHVAAETPPYVDGKYTATLLEAAASGCITFWHDTLSLGNDFESIIELPLEVDAAVSRIIEISRDINIEYHSRKTQEEIFDKLSPDRAMKTRLDDIRNIV